MFNRKLKQENSDLKKEIKKLKGLLNDHEMPKITYNLKDLSPEDATERKAYMARVALFYKEIQIPKLEQMISEQMSSLSNPINSSKFDQYIKGAINAFSLLLDWGDECINEHLADNNNENK